MFKPKKNKMSVSEMGGGKKPGMTPLEMVSEGGMEEKDTKSFKKKMGALRK